MNKNTLNNLDKIIKTKLLKECFKKNNIDDIENENKLNKENIKGLFKSTNCSKNHFYFENLSDDEFYNYDGINDNMLLFYRKINKSNCGVIISGGFNLFSNGKLIYNNDKFISLKNKFRQLTEEIHSSGTKILFKIKTNLGRFSNNKNKSISLSTNFGKDEGNNKKYLLRISDGKINKLIKEFIKVVDLANQSNFDGIVIDASHSNIMGELSSQEYNKRVFGYFSDTTDFLKKVLTNIKSKNNFICLKINITSLFFQTKNKINLCCNTNIFKYEKIIFDLIEYIKYGIDAFEFVFGRDENEFLTNFNSFQEKLIFIDFIKIFKQILKNSNIFNKFNQEIAFFYHDNFINECNIIESISIIDYFDVTKNIYADINYLNSIKDNINYLNCIKCNNCNKNIQLNNKISCVINPKLTDYEDIKQKTNDKKIAIIGAGISGLYCAKILAERGYSIDLFDKNDKINITGHQLSMFGYDYEITKYNDNIEKEINNYIEQNKINLFLKSNFTLENNNYSIYNSIVIATGFQTRFLTITGSILSHVKSIYEILNNKQWLYNKNNVIVYAKSEISIKFSFILSLFVKNLTVIINNPKQLLKNKNANLLYYFYNLIENSANILLFTKVLKINEDNIEVILYKNNKQNSLKNIYNIISNIDIKYEIFKSSLDCDLFIYEPDRFPNNKLFYELVNANYSGELYLIGNSLENCDLSEAIKSAYFVGKNL